jgi:hypothetical protein
MLQNQLVELVAVKSNRRVVPPAFGDSEREDFGVVVEGNSPHSLQSSVDVIRGVFYGYVVCTAEDYGPVIGIMGMNFFIYNSLLSDIHRYIPLKRRGIYSHAF